VCTYTEDWFGTVGSAAAAGSVGSEVETFFRSAPFCARSTLTPPATRPYSSPPARPPVRTVCPPTPVDPLHIHAAAESPFLPVKITRRRPYACVCVCVYVRTSVYVRTVVYGCLRESVCVCVCECAPVGRAGRRRRRQRRRRRWCLSILLPFGYTRPGF